MKRLSLIALFFLTLATSCRKSGSSGNPDTNTFQLLVNGKTYSATNTFNFTTAGLITNVTPSNYSMLASLSTFGSANSPACNIYCDIAGKFQFNFEALSDSAYNQTGTYTLFNNGYPLIDSLSGAVYTTDSGSTINITEADSAWIVGSMNFTLSDNSGNKYTGTGSFKISSRN